MNENYVPEKITSINNIDAAVGEILSCTTASAPDIKYGVGKIINFSDYSCLNKLLKVAVYCPRFMNNCSRMKDNVNGPITIEETDNALKQVIKWDQKKIKDDKDFSNMKKQLLFEGEDGLLRLNGRLENSHLLYQTKHPILLDQNSYLTKLIVYRAHQKVKHEIKKHTK